MAARLALETPSRLRLRRVPVSMPDTAENQQVYPQPPTTAGLGFPLARIAAVFSLACGAVMDLGICRYAGKGQSELGMLRTLWDGVRPAMSCLPIA